MAMNFKIFDTAEFVHDYAGDMIRKQVHNNPNSVLLLESAESLNGVYEVLEQEVSKYPANFSQVNIVMANNRGSLKSVETLKVPDKQFRKSGKQDELQEVFENKDKKKRFINLAVLELRKESNMGFENGDNDSIFDGKEILIVATGQDSADYVQKLYEAKDYGSDNFSKVKKHRMVTVLMDKAAASSLDPDIVEYYSYKYA